jgi:signal transduction histidine kinase
MSEHVFVDPPAERLPIRRRDLSVLLTTALLLSGLWGWVTMQTPARGRDLVATVGALTGLLLCAAVALAMYLKYKVRLARAATRRVQALAEQERADLQAQVERERADLARLVDQMMPAAVSRLRAGASADTVFGEMPPTANETYQNLLRMFIVEIGVGERRSAAATAACAGAAGRVQALSTRMQASLRELQDRYPDEFLGDLLTLDHLTAQVGRIADSIAVLTGARSGRRWGKPINMESILRGATGRIDDYQRVQLESTSTAEVAGDAAEGVMQALAELLDNAARFSVPPERVHVIVEELTTGVLIRVEDSGLGMKPPALARAWTAVSSTQPPDLTTLSGTRLGLAVVGRLAHKHGLKVFFRASSRGGTGVVLSIPSRLITQVRPESALAQAASRHRAPAREVPAARLGSAASNRALPAGSVATTAPRELPRRPPGGTLPPASPPVSRSEQQAPRSAGDVGSRLGAIRDAIRPTLKSSPPAHPTDSGA